MANVGKVRRVIREAVAILVGNQGHEEAANVLEIAVAKLRGAGDKPKLATAAKIQARLQTAKR